MVEDVWSERIYTRRYVESVRGILLCGINPGDGAEGRATSYIEGAVKSFFSDPNSQNGQFPYQRRIRDWFRIWGHRLEEVSPRKLERSISQANWFAESTRHAGALYSRAKLIECAEAEFIPILETVRPRLLVFFGVQHLPGAFADRRLRERETAIFGSVTDEMAPTWHTRSSGRGRFRAMSMAFERCQVLGLPHPTPPSRALSDSDVALLGPMFSSALAASGILDHLSALVS